ncbi:uncharacterized protein UDID_17771 [Ustilago sp. UG-2017a]|nr:uncharacterized protein UDID_17771 [Ustilago sp. UG-2017a]
MADVSYRAERFGPSDDRIRPKTSELFLHFNEAFSSLAICPGDDALVDKEHLKKHHRSVDLSIYVLLRGGASRRCRTGADVAFDKVGDELKKFKLEADLQRFKDAAILHDVRRPAETQLERRLTSVATLITSLDSDYICLAPCVTKKRGEIAASASADPVQGLALLSKPSQLKLLRGFDYVNDHEPEDDSFEISWSRKLLPAVNAFDIYQVADMYGVDDLRAAALRHIRTRILSSWLEHDLKDYEEMHLFPEIKAARHIEQIYADPAAILEAFHVDVPEIESPTPATSHQHNRQPKRTSRMATSMLSMYLYLPATKTYPSKIRNNTVPVNSKRIISP